MSKFMDNITKESWQTMLDKVPGLGEYINDKLNKPLLDKFMADHKVKKYIIDTIKSQHAEDEKFFKQKFPNGERKLSLKKPSGEIQPLTTDKREIRRIEHSNNLITYPYTLDGIRITIGVDGKNIRQVSYYCYEYYPPKKGKDGGWFEQLASIPAPTKEDLLKYWEPMDYEKY